MFPLTSVMLMLVSSIPANVKFLFLSLAFYDRAVGLFAQPMRGVIITLMLSRMAANGKFKHYRLVTGLEQWQKKLTTFMEPSLYNNLTAYRKKNSCEPGRGMEDVIG